ncbi:MAG: hypothetical protein Q7J45_00755 [bacterium]|nr:hypothetical protein [bacterium]
MATRSPQSKSPSRSTKTRAIKPAAVPKRKAGGRPSAYSQEFDQLAYNLTLVGLTLEEMAVVMNVAVSTIGLWIKKHRTFSDAITRARPIADVVVDLSLRDMAQGYGYTGYESHKIRDPKTGIEEVILVEVPQFVPKNFNAAKFWLLNRQPKRWKATPEEHDDGKNSGPVGKITVSVQASPFKEPEELPKNPASKAVPDA